MKFVKKRLFLCKKIHLLQLIPIVHESQTNGTARYIFRNGLKLHAAAFQKNITKVSPPQRHIRFFDAACAQKTWKTDRPFTEINRNTHLPFSRRAYRFFISSVFQQSAAKTGTRFS